MFNIILNATIAYFIYLAFNYAYYLTKIVAFTPKKIAVNISAASALTDYGDPHFFHKIILPDVMS